MRIKPTGSLLNPSLRNVTIDDIADAAIATGCGPRRQNRKERRRAKHANKKNLALLAGLIGVGLKEAGAEGEAGVEGLNGSVCTGHSSWRDQDNANGVNGDVSTTATSASTAQPAVSGRSIETVPEDVTYTVVADFSDFGRRGGVIEVEFDDLERAEAFAERWQTFFSSPRFSRFGEVDVTIVPSSVPEQTPAPADENDNVGEKTPADQPNAETDEGAGDGETQGEGAHEPGAHEPGAHEHGAEGEGENPDGNQETDGASSNGDGETNEQTSTPDGDAHAGHDGHGSGHGSGDSGNGGAQEDEQNTASQGDGGDQGASEGHDGHNHGDASDQGAEGDNAAQDAGGDAGHNDNGHSHGDASNENSAEHANHAHPDDPAKASEHMALLDLVPVSEATHVAVNNGSWFDPATWAGGEVPGEGAKVVIPSGMTVDYDGESPVSLFTVRVDGALDFATDVDTFMEVDTFVVSPSGTLTIGTADNPVDPSVNAVISIADNGDIDVAWDPKLLSRGLISHGTIEIHGTEKENFLKVADDPMKGDTSLTLDGAAEGWQVGDTIVLTGTRLTQVQSNGTSTLETGETQDEELVITRIEGSTIYFDKPLAYDHDGPRADLKAYVSNQTRNVRIETENGDDLPVHQRGHVMLMHSDDIDVRYAQFDDLGRTDKSTRSVDVGAVDDIAADTNVQGRYALHVHRSGVGSLDDPAMIVGNAVNGVVGWGIVHHDSHAVIASNNVYDIIGAGIIAEAGNETGRWVDNIAIKAFGVDQLTKHGDDVDAFDLARNGTGFWFQSRMVEGVDNVAAGMPGGHGFVYFSRGEDPFNSMVDPDTLQDASIFKYSDEGKIDRAPITIFNGNEAFAVETGLEVIKANPEQDHDRRSNIQDFTVWEAQYGIRLEYTAHYTFQDLDLVGSDADFLKKSYGVFVGNNTFDLAFNGVTVDGFQTGFHTNRKLVNDDALLGDAAPFNYIFVDVDVIGAETDFDNPHPTDIFLTSDQLVEGRLDYDPTYDGFLDGTDFSNGWIFLPADKTDSVGTTRISSDASRISLAKSQLAGAIRENGYWETEDGTLITVVEQLVSDRATGEPIKVGIFVELGANLNDYNWYLRNDPEPSFNGVFNPSNEGPSLVNDAVTVKAGESITIDVLANDSDAEGDTLDLNGLWSDRGSIRANDDGTVTYAADEDWTGEDVFRYFVDDGQGNFDYATVTVTVEA